MNKKQLINRHARNLKSLVGTGLAQDECEDIIKYAVNEALTLYGVGSSKLNEWIKIDPTKANTIPEKPVWIITIEDKRIEYKEADDFIELNYASHYRLIDKPEPPL